MPNHNAIDLARESIKARDPDHLTANEWNAVLYGGAIPYDMRPGESAAQYVCRKFDTLVAQRDTFKRHLDETNAELEGT